MPPTPCGRCTTAARSPPCWRRSRPEARPGTQALAFHALRWLGSARTVRTALAARPPPPAADALLLVALALLWPAGGLQYADHTVVDQAVRAARGHRDAAVRSAAPFVNAVLRRFLREREALVAAAGATPEGRWNHPAWWVERLRADWPEALAAGARSRQRPTRR